MGTSIPARHRCTVRHARSGNRAAKVSGSASCPSKPIMKGDVMKRRFEFVAGTSDKFWEVTHAGSQVEVRYGRNGTEGQSAVKSFPDKDGAAKHVEKLIR